MYQMTGTGTGALAATGAALAFGWIATWTLLAAGLALVSVARVLSSRARRAGAGR
ncbi:hypothetical protein [Cellulomonas phragmiteti]|uniref:Peptidase n=1 Tax=Cellulomonas phragmiteti TaxID=478780 RepID=A0ABQ4DKK3_9CELL|nr:hypothetical protein [Cellulomonas phragmiteti]GIG39456.1 hypothetical protein Cph01nite_12180 [Cellulomonas phragmiteti]